MYYKYNKENSIFVDKPFERIITPCMTPDIAEECSRAGFSIHYTEWAPGSQVDNHKHDAATEAMICVSGSGIASINEDTFELCPDSMIVAMPGEMHCIKNTGSVPLRCLCIFSPPITAEELRSRANAAVESSKQSEN